MAGETRSHTVCGALSSSGKQCTQHSGHPGSHSYLCGSGGFTWPRVQTVWKYSLALVDGPQPLVMPEGAQLLHVAAQENGPNIWVLCDPDAPRVTRKFVVAGTGHTLPGNTNYIGSCQERIFVWHVFELRPDENGVKP